MFGIVEKVLAIALIMSLAASCALGILVKIRTAERDTALAVVAAEVAKNDRLTRERDQSLQLISEQNIGIRKLRDQGAVMLGQANASSARIAAMRKDFQQRQQIVLLAQPPTEAQPALDWLQGELKKSFAH